MTNDTIKEIINDTRDLAATRKNPMTRLALEGIANRLQTLCDAGLYITPKAAVDAVAGDRPLDAMLKNPPLVPGDLPGGVDGTEPAEPAKRGWLELPRCITLNRFCNTKRETIFVGQYRDNHNSGCDNPRRVYQVKVTPDFPGAEIGTDESKVFTIDVSEDGKLLFSISTGRGRSIAEHLGVKSLKAWLGYMIGDKRRGKEAKKRHRKQNKKNRRARRKAANPVNPVNPV